MPSRPFPLIIPYPGAAGNVKSLCFLPYSLYNVGSTEKGAESLKTLVIIPAFNEQAAIVPFVEELKTVCPACDLIVIND